MHKKFYFFAIRFSKFASVFFLCIGETDSSNNEESEGRVLGSSGVGAAASYHNMVAAMNEILSSTSSTNSLRTTATLSGSNHHRHHPCIKDSIKSLKDNQHKYKSNNQDLALLQGHTDHGQLLTKSNSVGVSGYPCDFDHMYASMTDGSAPGLVGLGTSPLRGGGSDGARQQSEANEVKHLKELLLLHLDLIQQQSEQIVTKDKLLAALRQENETVGILGLNKQKNLDDKVM